MLIMKQENQHFAKLKAKILIIDDEPDILEFVTYNLEKEGFSVSTASGGEEGIAKAKMILPDLVLLDVMMPKTDGIEVCEELRKIPAFDKTLIVFFTARGEDYSQIAGYKSGADGYITKPIRPKLLIAQISAMLKRNLSEGETTLPEKPKGIQIDTNKMLIYRGEKTIVPTKMEFNLLTLLMSRPGDIFTRTQIFNTLWGDNSFVSDRTIDVHIRKLREKIGDDCIKTIKGVGYKYNEEFE